jgi:chromosome segregation ATPase
MEQTETISPLELEVKELKKISEILSEKIDKTQADLQRVLSLLEELNIKGKRMDEHIDFIESTYEGLKRPIDFVKQKIDTISNYKLLNQN